MDVRIFLSCLLVSLYFTFASAQNDSVWAEHLLQKAATLPLDSNRILFFARQLVGVPYAAGTLDKSSKETLVVHLDQVDCTTFVEIVLALSISDKRGERKFASFKESLRQIRYRHGELKGYTSRLHYFSDWIRDNEKKGFVRERTGELSRVQQILNLHFMSAHPESYRQLKENTRLIAEITQLEQAWQGVPVYYLPKDELLLPSTKLAIRDGDILAITTNLDGLDVVHTGFAFWTVDGKLHLLHASSVMKKVIADPQPLFDYSKNKKAHTGVRVISFLP